MAGEINKTIILGIEFDTKDLARDAAKLQQEIEGLKESQSKFAKGTVTYEEIGAKLRVAQNEYRKTKKEIDNVKIAQDKNTGSIKQMRAELAVATTKYNAMSEAQRTSTKAGQDLAKSIKQTSDRLKEAEGAIGDNRRNVGNYAESIKQAIGEMKVFGVGMGDIIKGAGMLAGAFMALKGVVEFFKKVAQSTEAGADSFGFAVAAMNKGTNEFLKTIQTGDWSNFLTNMRSAIDAGYEYAKVLDEIEDRNRAVALQEADAIKQRTDLELKLKNATLTVEERKKAGEELIKLEKQLNTEKVDVAKTALDAELAIASQETKLKQDAILNLLKDYDKDKRAKVDAYNAAVNEMQKAESNFITAQTNSRGMMTAATIKMYTDEIKKREAVVNSYDTGTKKMAKSLSMLGNMEDGRADKIVDLYTKYKEQISSVESENIKVITKISQLENDLQKGIVEGNKKANEEIAKNNEEARNKRNTNLIAGLQAELVALDKNSIAYLNKKIELINKQRDIDLQNTDLTENQRKLIIANANAEVVALGDDLINQKNEQYKKDVENYNKSIEDKRLADIEEINMKRLKDTLLLEQDQLTKEQFKTNEITYLEEIKNLYAENSKERIGIEIEIAKKKKDIEVNTAEVTKELVKAGVQDYARAMGELFGSVAGLFEQGTDEYKAFATAQAVINTILGAIGAFNQASLAYAPPAGQIIGAIAAAGVTASGYAQIAKIQAMARGGAVFPKAEFGMVLGGNPHSAGGTKFVGSDGTRFEAEKDELLTVVNKRSTRMLQRLSALNVAGGGIDFYRGARTHLADGGMVQRAMNTNIEGQAESAMMMQRMIASMPPPIVLVEDINKTQGIVTKVKSRATL